MNFLKRRGRKHKMFIEGKKGEWYEVNINRVRKLIKEAEKG
jgi:hypothetical protein